MGIQPKVQPATGLAAELNIVIDDLFGPASYVTGGVTVSASAFGLQKIKSLALMDRSSDNSVFAQVISPSKGSAVASVKLQWYTAGSFTEIGNGVNLSTKSIRFTAFGV